MGYSTDFSGEFILDKPLTQKHYDYLTEFARTRRMKRKVAIVENMPDPLREAAGLPVGVDGGYFVGADGHAGQDHGNASIVDYNQPPTGQPGLWCQWTPAEQDTIEWDQGEKFYNYIEWLRYIIEHFLKPWGYVVNGEVYWTGEDRGDRGILHVRNNVVGVSWCDERYKPVQWDAEPADFEPGPDAHNLLHKIEEELTKMHESVSRLTGPDEVDAVDVYNAATYVLTCIETTKLALNEVKSILHCTEDGR